MSGDEVPMELIERVARAICLPIMREFDGWPTDVPVPFERIPENDRKALHGIARAAIAAILEGVEPVVWRYHYPGSEQWPRLQQYEGMSPTEECDGMIETPLYDLTALREALK